MNRREMLLQTGAAALTAGLSRFPLGWAAGDDAPKRHILMYTRSQGFEHPVVKRENGKLSLAERIATKLGHKHNFDVTCTKDGAVFNDLSKYDAFWFETTGDLTQSGGDNEPPMTKEGKKALLKAIAAGKGFVGCHSASDTFHSAGERNENQPHDKQDPYIRMLGGEFIIHGDQQKTWMRVVDHHFPGTKDLKDFEMMEEWYALKNFAPDLRVIFVQETKGMKGEPYQRPPYPATWARMHHKGRVFFTSMGHREDVWESPTFQQVVLGGLSWAVGNVEADLAPNIKTAAPHASALPETHKKK
ncbi:MAG TPA: ThuA domain-containing protein [Gemmataceae bacterium]|jgi:hypothetical protein|nr:ThuA domain-containing protein [Gemmataceae bacterium]